MSLKQDIIDGKRLNSNLFTINEHVTRQGYSPLDLWDFKTLTPINGWKYIGWVPSASTCIPKSNWGVDCDICVLLEKCDVYVWLHVPSNDELIHLAFTYWG